MACSGRRAGLLETWTAKVAHLLRAAHRVSEPVTLAAGPRLGGVRQSGYTNGYESLCDLDGYVEKGRFTGEPGVPPLR